MAQKITAALVEERKRRSLAWMSRNFYDQWESAFKSYYCERDPEKDDDGNPDPDQSSVGMPDTWAYTRRAVARVTAQPPVLRFKAKQTQEAMLISRSLMYQWDKARIQRNQKRHMLQTILLGWSVRPWYWLNDTYTRRRKINPLNPATPVDDETMRILCRRYGRPPQMAELAIKSADVKHKVLAKLLADYGRNGYLEVEYTYCPYQGPASDFLFAGDCFPEPNLQSIQTSQWFICERRRDKAWMDSISKVYPELAPGLATLRKNKPYGDRIEATSQGVGSGEARQRLYHRLMSSIDMNEWAEGSNGEDQERWVITEMWVPGRNSTLTLTGFGDDETYIGTIRSPYDLDGKIPFTESVLIDSILHGIGDAVPRVMRGLQGLHDRQANVRMDLVYALLRPYMKTNDSALYENPELVRRSKGMRLILAEGPGALEVVGEQAAIASVAVGLNDESAIQRQMQMLTAENNMSMSANVDPQQAKTATGVRAMSYYSDIVSKDLIDMMTESSLKSDAEMMYLLNRSELTEGFEFEGSQYNRDMSAVGELKEQWLRVEPETFQVDGEVVAEAGSTLADDDEARVQQATTLWQSATSRPDVFNVRKAAEALLVSLGKRNELQEWLLPPAPPPPPLPPHWNLTTQVPWDVLTDEERKWVMERAGAPPPAASSGGGPPPAGGPSRPAAPAHGAPPAPMPGAAALAAAKGQIKALPS